MASIGSDPNGAKRILFVGSDRKRYTVRLGKVPVKTALAVCGKIEALNAARLMQQPPDDETARWVAGIDSTLHDRLAAVGLVAKRANLTLGPFLDSYIAGRTDVDERTLIAYGNVRRCLLACFPAGKALREISEGDANDFRIWLALPKDQGGQGLAENTIRRRCSIARQFFKAAVSRRLISSNPFAEMKQISVRANHDRERFIDRATAAKVLDACPDAQWRLLFALSRYGGLRCPSEHLALRWGDLDWERNRIRVISPKTAHTARDSVGCRSSPSCASRWQLFGSKRTRATST